MTKKLYGNGSKDNPFEIYNESDLMTITQVLAEKNKLEYLHFKLMNDINLGQKILPPIGAIKGIPFRGIFDGNHYTIKNGLILNPFLYQKDSTTGLFSRMEKATIKDLTLENIGAIGYHDIGIIAGSVTNSTIQDCTIENCFINISTSFKEKNSKTDKNDSPNIGSVAGVLLQSNYFQDIQYEVMIHDSTDSYLGELCGSIDKQAQIINCTPLKRTHKKISKKLVSNS